MVSSNAVHPVAPTPLVAGVNRGEAYHHPFNRKDSQAAQIGEQLEHDELESIENPSAKSPTACRTLTVGGENFSLPMKYLAYRVIGRGSYGVVISGKDCDTNTDVAIKKNKNVFSRVVKRRMSESEKQELHISKITKPRSLLSQIRLLREIKITQHLNHPNIISLLDIIRPTSIDVLVDVFTVNELMESDLRDVLNSRQTMSNKHIQFIIYQLLLGLQYMHSANIVHRDIKPENILINSDCHIKICDLGMSRAIDFETDPTMSTNYVVTRYYRAPELLLNNDEVSRAMDVWAAGCVFGELINGRIVFSGESPIDQIMSIIRKLGTPSTSDIKASHEGMMFMKQQKHYDAIPFEQLFPKADAVTVDLLSKLLVFNHEQRITAAEALKHPYFDEVYGCNIGNTDTDGLYMAKSKFDFSFEDNLTDEEAVKQKTYETILEFHRLKKAKSFRPRKKDLETLVVDLQNELQKKEQENADLSRQVTLFKKMVNKDIAQNSQLSYQLSVSPRSSRVSSSRRSTEQHKSKCCFQ